MAEPTDSHASTPYVDRNDSSTDRPPSPPAKRRRTQGTSSRGVANLTPEQLARKRANDREAQRAIRERTKNQIDRLNQRIRDLESQQPYHDLQLVLREKDQVQADNADIRKRLESVLSIIQPVLRANGGLNELAAAAERSPLPVPPRDHAPHPVSDHRSLNSGHSTLHDGQSPHNGLGAGHSPAESNRPWQFPGDAPTSHVRRWSGESPHYESARAGQAHHDMPFDERMGVDFLLDNGQQRVVTDPNLPPPQQSTSASHLIGQHAPSMAPHLTIPRALPPTCPLDVILLDFLAERHARANEGVPLKTLVGPLYPNFTALVYPDRNVDAHPLSKLFTDILRTFPDICGLPEQVAIVYIMFLVMRWEIEPTQDNYDRMPDWVTPRASQLFTPHPCWMDHLPWPKLRDRCIRADPMTPFDSFFIPYTTTISLNWPYEPKDCLLPASKIYPHSSNLSSTSSVPAESPYSTAVHPGSPPAPATPAAASTPGTAAGKDDEQWLINPAFESHLMDLRNWSLGPSFRTAFPRYAELVRIKEGR